MKLTQKKGARASRPHATLFSSLISRGQDVRARFLSALVALALPAGLFAAPAVSNVAFVQQPDGAGSTSVRVTYDLVSPNGNATVSLLYSTNGGTSFSPATTTTGAVGAGVTPGTAKTIDWAVATDLPGQTVANNLVVRVLAEDGVAIPLTITSTLAESSVTQTASQTFTFTFGEGVTGFDATDVTVSGGTKGTFTPVSASSYTLAVTGTGGTVTASVGAAAATAASGSGNGSAAATPYSNFYQDTWTITLPGSVPMELIRIPAGTFTMGSPSGETSRGSDETQHTVTLSQDFYLGKTEVTQNQWVALQSFPLAQTYVGGTMPVHNVTWNNISSWMTALNTHVTEPGTFSLPTESQWEYAARAGTTTRFNFGNGFGANEDCSAETERTNNMWYCGNNSPNGTKLVGQKPANAWGLRDMHGNVWEWCSDWYDTYPGTVTDPTGPASGSARVRRGGSWDDLAHRCRSARRNFSFPSNRGSFIGFRVLAVRPMPLAITSTLAAGSVSETQTQTLTFTFDSAVSDFTASDVTLTGATKGTFTPVSSTVYTLDVTATGGTVKASVLKSPATVPATFSNFYQDTWTLNLPGGVPMELVRIPAGTFTMGSPAGELSRSSDEAEHQVTLSQDFYLGRTEVTQDQWAAIQSLPTQFYPAGSIPVHNVSWDAVQTWLAALDTAIIEPGSFGLPTESQWEYACRAGTTTRFSFGDGLSTDELCSTGGGRETAMWYCASNSTLGPKIVGQKPDNPWGLLDMHGNLAEWCSDWFDSYPAGPVTDPTGAASGPGRVYRGGSWNDYARDCRSAFRTNEQSTNGFDYLGFRVRATR